MKEYIFQGNYDINSLCDVGRDVEEAVNADFNDAMKDLDLVNGQINITITYTKESR